MYVATLLATYTYMRITSYMYINELYAMHIASQGVVCVHVVHVCIYTFLCVCLYMHTFVCMHACSAFVYVL